MYPSRLEPTGSNEYNRYEVWFWVWDETDGTIIVESEFLEIFAYSEATATKRAKDVLDRKYSVNGLYQYDITEVWLDDS